MKKRDGIVWYARVRMADPDEERDGDGYVIISDDLRHRCDRIDGKKRHIVNERLSWWKVMAYRVWALLAGAFRLNGKRERVSGYWWERDLPDGGKNG